MSHSSESERGITQPDQWTQVVEEMLAGKEYEPGSFDVYPIIGRISAGKNTIQEILIEWLQRDGYKVKSSSAGESIRRHQKPATGRTQMKGHFMRPAEVDRVLDIDTARNLINPANAGQILIPEGRLLGFISGKVKEAARTKGYALPGYIHPILIDAEDEVRYEREYEALHRNDPTITAEQAARLTVDRERGEAITFSSLYPELGSRNLYDIGLTNGLGEPVYECLVDTSEHSAAFSARKVYDFITQTAIAPHALPHQQR